MDQQTAVKVSNIKKWLGTGSINIFGLPMSGKDTVGMRLAELLGAKFLSSGIIIRAVEAEQKSHMTDNGQLIPTDKFYDIILPYFSREDLAEFPLILSSVGRWEGEENEIMGAATRGNHEIKAVILLGLSEADVRERWAAAQVLQDRGERNDDNDPKVFETRIREFNEKTLPVIMHYNQLGLLSQVNADGDRDTVFNLVLDALNERAVAELEKQAEAEAADASLANGHNGNRV